MKASVIISSLVQKKEKTNELQFLSVLCQENLRGIPVAVSLNILMCLVTLCVSLCIFSFWLMFLNLMLPMFSTTIQLQSFSYCTSITN